MTDHKAEVMVIPQWSDKKYMLLKLRYFKLLSKLARFTEQKVFLKKELHKRITAIREYKCEKSIKMQ